jgi:hypothetical protein
MVRRGAPSSCWVRPKLLAFDHMFRSPVPRLVSLVFPVVLTTGCLDDELDENVHFRLGVATIEDDTPAPASEDGGANSTPGKSIVLGDLSTFIALDRDFEDFQSWTSFDLGTRAHVTDQQGHTQVFINALPQPGDTEFRVGTLIVKVVEQGEDSSLWQVHAMVKRGSDFNTKGAYGWEYFDLALNDQGIPQQNWRGATVPVGESYQTTVFTSDGTLVQQDVPDCNICHQSSHNDAVNTEALALDRWQ